MAPEPPYWEWQVVCRVLALLQWFKQQGARVPLLFMLIMAAVLVLLLPNLLLVPTPPR